MYKIEEIINKIHCGDCLEVMREMPDGCVDFCIADPPFNVGLNYGADFNDKKTEGEYWEWLRIRVQEIYRVLKENSRLYIFHGDSGIFKLKPICESAGFKYAQNLIWHKPNLCSFKSGRITGDWHFMHENILLFHKGKRTSMISTHQSNCFSVFIYPSPQRNFKGGRDHPAQKPIRLYEDIIARTPGQIILDPFVGSGVIVRAAKDLKRDVIAIDINPDYCKIAEERLAQGVL